MRTNTTGPVSTPGYIALILRLLPLLIGIPLLMVIFGDFNGDSVADALHRSWNIVANPSSMAVLWSILFGTTLLTVWYLHPILTYRLCGDNCAPISRYAAVKIVHRFNKLHVFVTMISVAGFALGEFGSMSIDKDIGLISIAKHFLFLNALSKGLLTGVLLSFNLDNLLFTVKQRVLSQYPDIQLKRTSLYKKLFIIIGAIVFFLILQLLGTTAHFFSMGARTLQITGTQLDINFFFQEMFNEDKFHGTRGVFLIKIAFYLFYVFELIYQIKNLIRSPLRTIQERLKSLNSDAPQNSQTIDIFSNDEFSATFTEINKLIKRQQSELECSSNRLEMIVEQAADPILSFSDDGDLEIFNPAAQAFFGYTEQEMVGRCITELIDLPVDADSSCPGCAPEVALIEHLYSHNNGIRRFTGRRKDGSAVMFESNISKVNRDDKPIYTAILRDISAQLEIEETLNKARIAAENANRMKSEFLANMSHELRTPLNAVLGFTQLLSTDKNLTGGQLDKINIISRSGEHLLSLINDILDISKIEAGKLELHTTTFSVQRFVEDIREMFSLRCKKNGLSLYVEFAGELPSSVAGDLGKLRQVMINLVGNAVKFTTEGGIGILVGMDGGKIRFSVTDSGKGIPADELETIMQPFTQSSVTDNEGGTGLGLAISSRYIQMMGGELSVQSALGKGSTFSFALDLPETDELPPEQEAEPVAVAVKKGSSVTALIVDDKELNRLVLKEMLEAAGFNTLEAENGQVAVERIMEFKPRIVFMDIKMPVMDGYEAVRLIKEKKPDFPIHIFALTASAFTNDEEKILSSGFDGFLAKPFKRSAIFRLIKEKSGVELEYETVTGTQAVKVPEFDSIDFKAAAAALGQTTIDAISEAIQINDFTGVRTVANRFAPALPELAALIHFYAGSFDEAGLEKIVNALKNR